MGDVVEALFISASSEDNTTCSVQDLRTGTDLMKYKGGGNAQYQGLALLQSHYLMTANVMKPLLHVWPINGQEQMSSLRFVVPGKVNALALTPDGAFLVAAIQENIYLWHLNTGRMLNTLSKHYQAITCLRFTDNGEHFVSAGKDGAVLVWNLTQAVSPLDTDDPEANAPLYSFYDHGLTVTDVHLGLGGLRSYMYTVSLDRCCKIYDLNGGTMLLSVVFPVALHSVIVNRLETSVYVGTAEGQVLVFHMSKIPRMKEYHLDEEESQAFAGGHAAGKPVTCLALSMNAQQLVSGSEDKQVCVWDVGSHQLIKSLPQTGVVTNLKVRLCSPAMFQPEHKQPQLFANSLKRMISPADDEEECIELLVTQEYPMQEERRPKTFEERWEQCTKNHRMEDDEEEGDEEETNNDQSLDAEDGEDEAEENGENEEEEEEEQEENDENEEEEQEQEENLVEMEETGAGASSHDLQKLLEENARLKAESKRMFEIIFKYVASNPKQAQASSSKPHKRTRNN